MRIWATTLVFVAAILLCGTTLITDTPAQRRAQPFSHGTPAHKNGKYADCSVCHQLPTSNWTAARSDKQTPFPDVINFPNPHRQGAGNVCFACHTNDAFSGGGVFCGTCHTVPSMRARAVLPFPVQGRARQFNIIFPHDLHQDLIARERKEMKRFVAVAHFVSASFEPAEAAPADDFYNCAVCHKTTDQVPKINHRSFPLLKPLDNPVADTFERPVTARFFKDSPESHASCFNCHYGYQYLPQGKQNCAGCHELTKPYVEKRTIERYSMKFDHDRTEHQRDCAACHVRITQNKDIKTMKDADVPISTCWSCHATQEEARSRRILNIEIEARDKSITDKTAPFQCTYCHTSAVGRYEVPATHRKP